MKELWLRFMTIPCTVSGPQYVLNKYMDLNCPFIFEEVQNLVSTNSITSMNPAHLYCVCAYEPHSYALVHCILVIPMSGR